jgi:hypothetical protein
MPFIGSMRRIPTSDIDTNFDGGLRFYTFDSETRESWTYEATFTDGQCVEIACIEYEKPTQDKRYKIE